MCSSSTACVLKTADLDPSSKKHCTPSILMSSRLRESSTRSRLAWSFAAKLRSGKANASTLVRLRYGYVQSSLRVSLVNECPEEAPCEAVGAFDVVEVDGTAAIGCAAALAAPPWG